MLRHNIHAVLTYFNSFEASSSRQFTKEIATDEYVSTALFLVFCSLLKIPAAFFLSHKRPKVDRWFPGQLLHNSCKKKTD